MTIPRALLTRISLIPWARVAVLAASLGLGVGLGGCTALGKLTQVAALAVVIDKPRPTAPAWKAVTLTASADANQNSPVAIDLVFVRDTALAQTLTATPAAKWFATRADTQRAFPDTLGVVSLEIVPGQTLRLTDAATIGQHALVILAFANYPPPGEHRERLLPTGADYLVQLGPLGFKGVDVHAHPPK